MDHVGIQKAAIEVERALLNKVRNIKKIKRIKLEFGGSLKMSFLSSQADDGTDLNFMSQVYLSALP